MIRILIFYFKVKRFVRDLYAQCLTTRERKKRGILKSKELETMHMLFKGNPGTGNSFLSFPFGPLPVLLFFCLTLPSPSIFLLQFS